MAVPAPDLEALRLLGERVRPLSSALERSLPVPDALSGLLGVGGVPRGSTVATTGVAATSLALGLAAPATQAGSWLAAVGLPHLGMVAAAELGVASERVLTVVEPGPEAWASVVAALLDAVELVLVQAPQRLSPTVHRRLVARARERGSVLLQVGGEAGRWAYAPDLVLTGTGARWEGIEVGHGHLRTRRVQVSAAGRRGGGRERTAELWLPGPEGTLALAPPQVAAAPGPLPGPRPVLNPHLPRPSAPIHLQEVG